jgi:hypothetical protein
MKTKTFDDKYSDEEAQRRFEAALRGARIATPQPMKDIAGKGGRRIKKTDRSKPK